MRRYCALIILVIAGFLHHSTAQNSKYFVSKIYPKGSFEVHVFNNYYSQKDYTQGSDQYTSRTNFFTSSGQFLYGLNNRLNIGLNLRFRSVHQNLQELSPYFEALTFQNSGYQYNDDGLIGYSRTGITSLGVTVKYQPFQSFGNISFQHSLFIPVAKNLEGNDQTGWIDWSNPSLFNQFYFDTMIGSQFSIFAEFSLILENISGAVFQQTEGYYQFSSPITLILNYYVDEVSTLYLLANSAPRWAYSIDEELQKSGTADPYSQFGLGYKLFVHSNIQLELLYTAFYSAVPGRSASTVNIGLRYIGQ